MSKAADFGGPPFFKDSSQGTVRGEQIMREGNTQRLHAAVYRQRVDVSMDNGTRTLDFCEADRSDGVMGRIASLGSCVQVSSV